MKTSRSPSKFLYYFFAIFVLTFRFWGEDVNIYIKYLVSLPWLLYAFVVFLSRPRSVRGDNVVLHGLLMAAPVFVMALYAVILWQFNPDVIFRNYTRLCSTLIYLLIAWGYGAVGYYFFQKDAVDCLFAAGATSYFLGSLCCLVLRYGWVGIVAIVHSLLHGGENDITRVMEVHDLSFAMGIFFLYYLFFEEKTRKYHGLKIAVSTLIIIVGLKRIEFLALLAACAVYGVFLRKPDHLRFKANLFAVGGIGASFLYLYLIKTGLLNDLCSLLKIRTSGRLMAYGYAADFFELTPLFPGEGLTLFSRMWEQLYNNGFRLETQWGWFGVGASVHSDILSLYIENGFILFALWLWFFFSAKTKLLYRLSGERSARCYLLLTVYMFILYLTDNTFAYHDTQMLFLLAPLVLAEKPAGEIPEEKHR